jgi:GTP cyclohydrolase II
MIQTPVITDLKPSASAILPTKHGTFRVFIFESVDGTPYSVLTTPILSSHPLVRIHSECETGDVFGSLKCDCGEQLAEALRMIDGSKNGLLIYMRQHEGRGIGLTNKIRAYNLQEQGMDTVDANRALGLADDLRRYDIAADILKYFKATEINLLTNNPAKVTAMENLGITVRERRPLVIKANAVNKNYLDTKKKKMGHL